MKPDSIAGGAAAATTVCSGVARRASRRAAAAARCSAIDADAAALLALALPPATWSSLPDGARGRWLALVDPDRLPALVRDEAAHLRGQLVGLCALGPAGACGR